MHLLCACMSVVSFMCIACRGEKKALDLKDLMVVSHHVGAEN